MPQDSPASRVRPSSEIKLSPAQWRWVHRLYWVDVAMTAAGLAWLGVVFRMRPNWVLQDPVMLLPILAAVLLLGELRFRKRFGMQGKFWVVGTCGALNGHVVGKCLATVERMIYPF